MRGQPSEEGTGPGISPEDIADHNSRVVLALLRSQGPQTRQELSAQLSLTEPAITGIVKRLIAAGLVGEGKRDIASRYRAAKFSLIADSAYSAGLWLRPEAADLVVANLKGAIVERRSLEPDQISQAVAGLQPRWGSRIKGIGLALHPGLDLEQAGAAVCDSDLPIFRLKDTEAAVAAERMLGIGEPEGGFVVILIDDTVRAGMMTGGTFFRGVHGRAGEIGGMRPGREELTLDEVASARSFERLSGHAGPPEIEAWVTQAASRLLDAVVAITGFISPGQVLIGGNLPGDVLQAIIDRMNLGRKNRQSYFVAAAWIPPISRLSLEDRGVALGAAMVPFMELLLPRRS